MTEEILLGAHTSISGGLYHALSEGKGIGATTIQIFTANQRRWKTPALTEAAITRWKEELADSAIRNVMSHGSYLVNLGAPNPENLIKSQQVFKEELIRCHQLGITFLNIHPGAAIDDTRENCIQRIIESLLMHKELILSGDTLVLLETVAGQGSTIGFLFEEIGAIIKGVTQEIPIGVCMDTCHSFSAGYDIRTKQGWDETLDLFEQHVGLKYLQAFHVNDSMKPLGSRRDRHAPIGKGEIGEECFRVLMTHPKIRHIPKYLETPGGCEAWIEEIQLLRAFAQEK